MKIVTAEEFIAEGPQARSRVRKVTNLCRSYSYLGTGYYCSLLAEARGDRVTPGVEAILGLARGKARAASIAVLDRLVGPLPGIPRSISTLTLQVFFGRTEDAEFAALARRSFELFRCPLLEIAIERCDAPQGWHVAALQALDPRDVDAHRDEVFTEALGHFTRRSWRPVPPVAAPRMDLAILHDPDDPLPPSSAATLGKLVAIGDSMGIAAELIEKKDFRAWRSSMRCSSARPRPSTTTPSSSPSAPPRRACPSSTTRSPSCAAPTRPTWPSCCAATASPRRARTW